MAQKLDVPLAMLLAGIDPSIPKLCTGCSVQGEFDKIPAGPIKESLREMVLAIANGHEPTQ
jgi:hypothetical protein